MFEFRLLPIRGLSPGSWHTYQDQSICVPIPSLLSFVFFNKCLDIFSRMVNESGRVNLQIVLRVELNPLNGAAALSSLYVVIRLMEKERLEICIGIHYFNLNLVC